MGTIELTPGEKELLPGEIGRASAVLSFYLAPPLHPGSLAAAERALEFIFAREVAAKVLSWLAEEKPGDVSQELSGLHAGFHLAVTRARLVTLLPEGWDIIVSDFRFEGLEETPVLRTEFHRLSGETFSATSKGSSIFNLIDHFLVRVDEMAGFGPGRRWLAENKERLLELRSRLDRILMVVRDDSH